MNILDKPDEYWEEQDREVEELIAYFDSVLAEIRRKKERVQLEMFEGEKNLRKFFSPSNISSCTRSFFLRISAKTESKYAISSSTSLSCSSQYSSGLSRIFIGNMSKCPTKASLHTIRTSMLALLCWNGHTIARCAAGTRIGNQSRPLSR